MSGQPHSEPIVLVPVSPEQRRRIDSLTKQAVDALNILAEERLNLDSYSRDTLNEARGAVARFEYEVCQQPVQP